MRAASACASAEREDVMLGCVRGYAHAGQVPAHVGRESVLAFSCTVCSSRPPSPVHSPFMSSRQACQVMQGQDSQPAKSLDMHNPMPSPKAAGQSRLCTCCEAAGAAAAAAASAAFSALSRCRRTSASWSAADSCATCSSACCSACAACALVSCLPSSLSSHAAPLQSQADDRGSAGWQAAACQPACSRAMPGHQHRCGNKARSSSTLAQVEPWVAGAQGAPADQPRCQPRRARPPAPASPHCPPSGGRRPRSGPPPAPHVPRPPRPRRWLAPSRRPAQPPGRRPRPPGRGAGFSPPPAPPATTHSNHSSVVIAACMACVC